MFNQIFRFTVLTLLAQVLVRNVRTKFDGVRKDVRAGQVSIMREATNELAKMLDERSVFELPNSVGSGDPLLLVLTIRMV